MQQAPKAHARANSASPAAHADLFVLAINAETYRSLSDETKRVIAANSGADTSALLGQIFDNSQASPPAPAKPESSAAAQTAIEQRIQELDQRGLDGKELLESARALLAQFDPADQPNLSSLIPNLTFFVRLAAKESSTYGLREGRYDV